MSVSLHLGDCLEVLPTLEAGSVDAVVTDPPWKDYETGRYDASEWHAPIVALHPAAYLGQLYRVLRDGGAMLLWCDWRTFGLHASEAARAGFEVRNCVVWAKPNHTAGDLTGNFGYQHEMAVFAVKGDWKLHGRRDTNLWHEGHLFSRAKRDHPTQKPDRLMMRCVAALVPEGGVVADPFMGSGTTGVACVNTGRSFIGIEKENTAKHPYFAIAERRISEAAMQTRMAV